VGEGGVSSKHHKFGVDLSAVTLEEAIAAAIAQSDVIGAWYEAQNLEKPDYEHEHEGTVYYKWFKCMNDKQINRQTFMAIARSAFGPHWKTEVPCPNSYRGICDCITIDQLKTIEIYVARRKAGESMDKLRRELVRLP
jgi:hypothetical protein